MKILLELKTCWFTAALAILVCLSACKKSEETAATPTGTLYFHLHTNLDTNEVDYGIIYPDGSGHRMFLRLAQLYISGIKVVKADGSAFPVDNTVLLKVKDKEQYLVGEVPAGNYTSVTFQVGLDAATNQTNPSGYPSSNPLSVQDTSMWFGATSQGYIFVNVAGGVDTTAAQDATLEAFQPFSFQLGTSEELKTVSLPAQAFTVTPNQGQEVHITIDYAQLFQGLNPKTEHTATPFSNPSLATKVAGNVPLMFRYEM